MPSSVKFCFIISLLLPIIQSAKLELSTLQDLHTYDASNRNGGRCIQGDHVRNRYNASNHSAGLCNRGEPLGIAYVSLFLRYPTGWVYNYDTIAEGFHGAMEEIFQAMYIEAKPASKVHHCGDSVSHTNIISVRVCGVTDLEKFCYCTLKKEGARAILCKSAWHLFSGSGLIQFFYNSINAYILPMLERMTASAAISNNYLADGDPANLVALHVYPHTEFMQNWKDNPRVCTSARALIGWPGRYLIKTPKELQWAEVLTAVQPASGTSQAQQTQVPNPMCQNSEGVIWSAMVWNTIYALFR